MSKRLGFSLRKECLFTSGINLLPGRNRRIMAKKPATESSSAQGRRESLNHYRSELKLPSRRQAALSPVINEAKSPLYYRGF